MEALKIEILEYKPGKAVPFDHDEQVVLPAELAIGIVNNYMDVPVHAMRAFLYGKDMADSLQSGDRQTHEEQQQGLWITNSISLIITKSSRPDTVSAETSEAEGMEGATSIQDLAEKVGCMVKIVDVTDIDACVKESKKIKEITGRFPVCAILNSGRYVDRAINALMESGMTDHYVVVPWPGNIRTYIDEFEWLRLLHKCLPEADRMLAAKLRLESEKRVAQQKQRTKLKQESEIRDAQQKQTTQLRLESEEQAAEQKAGDMTSKNREDLTD